MIRSISCAEILASPALSALLAEYASECSIPEIGLINPQSQKYMEMEEAGIFKCFGAFEGERLIGFASLFTTVVPHYSRRVGTLESLFVARDFRKTGAGHDLMQAVEKYAKEAGCKAILYSAPPGGKLEQVLSRRKDMRKTNSVFTQRL